MNQKNINTILDQLKTILDQTLDENKFDQVDDALRALKKWDGSGEIPHKTKLIAWGVLAKQDEEAESGSEDVPEASLPVSDDPVAPTEEAEQEDMLEEPAAPTQKTEPAQEATVAEKPAESSPPPSDPDDGLMQAYNDALDLLDAKQYYQAVKALRKLRPTGRLFQPVQSNLEEARRQLRLETDVLIKVAEGIEQRKSHNLEAQEEAWQAVLDFNPDSIQATNRLKELQQRQLEKEISEDLDEISEYVVNLLPDIKAWEEADDESVPMPSLDLPEINTKLGQLQSWQIDEQTRELSDEFKDRVIRVYDDVKQLREKVRAVLGVASTMDVRGEYREAYRLSKIYFEAGTKVMVDAAGLMSPEPGAEVDTPAFFQFVTKNYIAKIINLVAQRIDIANAQRDENPSLARKNLEEALGFVDDDVLTQDHRNRKFTEERKTIQELIEDIERRITKYAQANTWIDQAQDRSLAAQEKLDLLEKAEDIYPAHPKLAARLEATWDLRAAELASEMAAEITKAQQRANAAQNEEEDAKFDEALQLLEAINTTATKAIASIKPDSHLVAEKARLEAEQERITAAQASHNTFLAVLAQIQQNIADYDDSEEPGKLVSARTQLEHIETAYHSHPAFIQLQGELAQRQGNEENWRSGIEAYEQQQWPRTLDLLGAIRSDFTEFEAAQTKINRARAAHYTLQAEEFETSKNWGKAVDTYTTANALFEKHQYDSYTQRAAEKAEEALKRLKPIEANDRRIRQLLQQAADNLAQGRTMLEARRPRALPNKLQPVTFFKDMVTQLEAEQQAVSSLASEIDPIVSEARNLWRDIYLLGIRDADGCGDERLLENAIALIDELNQQGLLYQRTDRQHAENIRCQHLDLAYARLMSALDVQWDEVEANRQELRRVLASRVGASEEDKSRKDEVDGQLREVSRRRIQARVETDLRKLEGASPAARVEGIRPIQAYLNTQLNTPVARHDETLIQQLVELYWKTESWAAAGEAATRFQASSRIENGDTKTTIWQSLTQAAQYYAELNIDAGRAIIIQLQDDYYAYNDLLQTKDDQFARAALERLLKEAEKEERKKTEEGYLEAAKKYAIAYDIDEENPIVRVNLQRLGGHLRNIVQARCVQAEKLEIGRRSLEAAMAIAEELFGTLTAIAHVGELLDLDLNTRAKLEAALRELEPKKETWESAARMLAEFGEQIEQSKRNPYLSHRDIHESGWVFDSAIQILQDAGVIARGADSQLLQLIEKHRSQLEEGEQDAADLEDLIHPFMQAIENEDFDAVIAQAPALDARWRDLSRRGWGGLKDLIHYQYVHSGEVVQGIVKHRSVAEDQRDNLAQWDKHREEFAEYGKDWRRLNKKLRADFEDLVLDQSIKEWKKTFDKEMKAIAAFEERSKVLEGFEPLSDKAEAQEEKLNRPGLLELSQSLKARITVLIEEADLAEKEFLQDNGNFDRLKRHMRQINNRKRQSKGRFGRRSKASIPENMLKTAEDLIKQCQRLDPLNEKLLGYEETVQALRTGKKE